MTFGFFQTQASSSTDNLDNVDFLVASASQDYVELSLFFNSSSFASAAAGAAATAAAAANAELLFHCFNQLNNVHYGHFSDSIQDIFFGQSHVYISKNFVLGYKPRNSFKNERKIRPLFSLLSGYYAAFFFSSATAAITRVMLPGNSFRVLVKLGYRCNHYAHQHRASLIQSRHLGQNIELLSAPSSCPETDSALTSRASFSLQRSPSSDALPRLGLPERRPAL